ncbi:hypothetical protein KGV52_00015 [Candidatus Gracilibacteria bacterium]|nr:hypothetical protein [Candidatus Gracilibacteria bacterium]
MLYTLEQLKRGIVNTLYAGALSINGVEWKGEEVDFDETESKETSPLSKPNQELLNERNQKVDTILEDMKVKDFLRRVDKYHTDEKGNVHVIDSKDMSSLSVEEKALYTNVMNKLGIPRKEVEHNPQLISDIIDRLDKINKLDSKVNEILKVQNQLNDLKEGEKRSMTSSEVGEVDAEYTKRETLDPKARKIDTGTITEVKGTTRNFNPQVDKIDNYEGVQPKQLITKVLENMDDLNINSFDEMVSKMNYKTLDDFTKALKLYQNDSSKFKKQLEGKYTKDGWFFGPWERGDLVDSMDTILANQKILRKAKSLEDKLRVVMNFDKDGVSDTNVNFYVREADMVKLGKDEKKFAEFLDEIGYEGGLSAFKQGMEENYYATRKTFMEKVHETYGDPNKQMEVGDTKYRRRNGNVEQVTWSNTPEKVFEVESLIKHVNLFELEELGKIANGSPDDLSDEARAERQKVQGELWDKTDVITWKARANKGALDAMNPKKDTSTRFAGLKRMSQAASLNSLKSALVSGTSEAKQDMILDALMPYLRKSQQAIDIMNGTKTESSMGRYEKFNSLLGANLNKERENLYALVDKKATPQKVYGLFIDPVASVNVENKAKVEGLDKLNTTLPLLSNASGQAVMMDITGTKKAQLLQKFQSEGILGTEVKVKDIDLKLAKDALGLDDQIKVEFKSEEMKRKYMFTYDEHKSKTGVPIYQPVVDSWKPERKETNRVGNNNDNNYRDSVSTGPIESDITDGTGNYKTDNLDNTETTKNTNTPSKSNTESPLDKVDNTNSGNTDKMNTSSKSSTDTSTKREKATEKGGEGKISDKSGREVKDAVSSADKAKHESKHTANEKKETKGGSRETVSAGDDRVPSGPAPK